MKSKQVQFRFRVFLLVAAVVTAAVFFDHVLTVMAKSILAPDASGGAMLAERLVRILMAVPGPVIIFGGILVWYLRPVERAVRRVEEGESYNEEEYRRARRALMRYPYLNIALVTVGFLLGSSTHVFREQVSSDFQTAVAVLRAVAYGGLWAHVVNGGIELVLTGARRTLRVNFVEPEKGDKVSSLRTSRVFALVVLAATFFFHGLDFAFVVAQTTTTVGFETVVTRLPAAIGLEFVGLALVAAVYTVVVTRSEILQVRALRDRLTEIVHGEAGTRELIEIIEVDEIGQITDLINRFTLKQQEQIDRIRTSARQVADSAEQLEQTIEQVASVAEELAAGTEQVDHNAEVRLVSVQEAKNELESILQSNSRVMENLEGQKQHVDETSSAVTEMAESIRSVSSSTDSASGIAKDLEKVAHERGAAVQDTIQAITQINEASNQVNEIVAVIGKISAQTNMLAMNAAIEAAHAGDAGRGFAVVAEEVRSLATDSSSNTKEINGLIKQMVQQVDEGVSLSKQAGDALRQIEEGIQQTTQRIQQISEAMKEQSAGTSHILESIQALVQASELIRTEAVGQGERNDGMRGRMEEIVQSFQEIRNATREQAQANREIAEAVVTLKDVANTNHDAVEGLRTLISDSSPAVK